MLTKEKLKYLKENTSPIIKINPPWYWVKMDLHIIGDAIVDLPREEDYAWLRVMVVQEDTPVLVEYGAIILSAKEAEDMVWNDEVIDWS